VRSLGRRKRAAFQKRFVGRELEVLVEGKRDKRTGKLRGYSRNYIPVLIEGEDGLINQEIRVSATGLEDGRVLGRAVGETSR
jgi:threonylcarbamoyladenosine tRNA methylthiotransferase MtaB